MERQGHHGASPVASHGSDPPDPPQIVDENFDQLNARQPSEGVTPRICYPLVMTGFSLLIIEAMAIEFA